MQGSTRRGKWWIAIGIVAALVGAVLGFEELSTNSPCIGVPKSAISLEVRPIYCFAYRYEPPPRRPKSLPACGRSFVLSRSNVGVQREPGAPGGWAIQNVPADWHFLHIPSTVGQRAITETPALLDGPQAEERYVVGPVLMSGDAIASAVADQGSGGQWEVELVLTTRGSREFDQASKSYFHRYLAFVVDGKVVSAPLIEPSASTWTTFDGMISVPSLTHHLACSVAIGLSANAHR